VAVTKQWQIYVPEEVRQALAWVRPERARVELKGKAMVVIPEESRLMKLAGKYRVLGQRKKIDVDKIRAQIDYSQL